MSHLVSLSATSSLARNPSLSKLRRRMNQMKRRKQTRRKTRRKTRRPQRKRRRLI